MRQGSRAGAWVVISGAAENRLEGQTQVGGWHHLLLRGERPPVWAASCSLSGGAGERWGWLLGPPLWAAWPSASALRGSAGV